MTKPSDSYWDNVGGETLEAALDFAAHGTRVIVSPLSLIEGISCSLCPSNQVCGNISAYNTKEPYGVKNLQLLLWREIKMYGFLWSSLSSKHGKDFFENFPKRVASGEIKYKEHAVRGLENAGQAILDVQQGKNFGKSVIIVADE